MQIKENFILRNIGNEHMVMPTGENIAKFGGAVVLSDTAAFIFEQLKQPTSREDLLTLLLSEFDVDAETAAQDLDELLTKFKEMGFLEVLRNANLSEEKPNEGCLLYRILVYQYRQWFF